MPQSAIDALGLAEVPGLPYGPMGDDAANCASIYLSCVHFEGRTIHQYVAPESEPTVGADALRALGYEVDLERGCIAKPTEPLKFHHGLMPGLLDVSDLQFRN